MSLYRKYRPQTFADVVGQDHIVTTLEQAAKQEKLSHAYLFSGGRGTGKTSVARILAKIIMIQGIQDEVLQRQIIKGVEDGSIVDLLEIDAASNTGVDNIRDLIEKIQFSPVVAGAKVYIIDEAHMLSKGAFNALLKTLEEPPPYAHFILATTELQKIPATIRSRCQCFPFRSVREEDIVRRLQFIADQERIAVEREALRVVAKHVGGGMRDAISLLDQMRALPKITAADVEQRLGGTGQEHVEGVMQALESGDRQSILDIVSGLEENGAAFDTFLRQLLTVARMRLHDAVDQNAPADGALTMMDVLLQAIRDVRVAPVPGLIVESALLTLCDGGKRPERPSKKESREKEKERERETEKTPPADSAPSAVAAVTEKPATFEAPEISMAALRDHWEDIVGQTAPPAVKMSLKNGRLSSLEGSRVIVAFGSAFHRDKVKETDASRRVEEIMNRIFRSNLRLECVMESEVSAMDVTPSESAVNLAEAAAEIF